MKKSKVDRIIKAKLAEASEKSLKLQGEARRQERERYEMQCVPPDDGNGTCVLGAVPEGRLMRVAIGSMYAPRLFDPKEMDPYFFRNMQFATFEPIMKCQQFGNGQRVVWYEWLFRGIQG